MSIALPNSPFSNKAHSQFVGVRAINFRKDVPQIMKLLRLAFEGSEVQKRPFSSPFELPPFWSLNVDPMTNRLRNGFVWEDNGRLAGNLTILRYPTSGRFLIVNVAVHPNWRRRGIAQKLMLAAMNLAKAEGQTAVLLQVDKSNDGAQALYQQMNFETVGHMARWQVEGAALRRSPLALQEKSPDYVRRLRSREWQEASAIDRAHLSPEMDWPEPMPPDLYKTGLGQRFFTFINGRSFECWTVAAKSGALVGIASIWGEWGQPYRARLRILPSWTGKVERPLLLKTIERLRQLSSNRIYLDHPDDNPVMNDLLRSARFRPRRTLTHMKFTF